MDKNTQGHTQEDHLAFFATIGAGVSHEMRNVLSIVGEYAGLLNDLLAAAERGKSIDSAKLTKLATNITRQVKKGTEAMERFSRFAHAADEPTAPTDLATLTGNVVALARRHASVPGCTLQPDFPETGIQTTTSPFRLQHAVFSAIQLVLQTGDQSQPVTIKLAKQGSTAVVSVSDGACDSSQLALGTPPLSAIMAELGGEVEVSTADGRRAVILTLPIEH